MLSHGTQPDFVAPDGSGRIWVPQGAAPLRPVADVTHDVMRSVRKGAAVVRMRKSAELSEDDQVQQIVAEYLADRRAPLARAKVQHRDTRRVDPETGEIYYSDVPQLVQAAESADLPVLDESARDRRRFMYALQAVAGRLAKSERVACCHKLPQDASLVEVRRSEGRSYLSGVQTCGSVWHCPICAAKVTEARRADLQHMAQVVRAGDGQLLMLTLTVPHQLHDALQREDADGEEVGMISRLTAAWRYFVSGKNALSRILEDQGYLGFVRALEVTHGKAHGWHPHLHVLVAIGTPLDDDQVQELQQRLVRRWSKACEKQLFGAVDPVHGLRIDVPRVAGLDTDPVTSYVTKWGAAEELSKLHSKQGKRTHEDGTERGRSPWALLHDANLGDQQAGALWMEYARAFKGRRQLVWSRGFRTLVGLDELDPTDEALAAVEPEVHETVRVLERHEWVAVRAFGERAALLDHADWGPAMLERYIDGCLQQWWCKYGDPGRVRCGDDLVTATALSDQA